MEVTFKVEKNEKYGDYRVNKYLNGVWINQRDNNWSKRKAEEIAEKYRANTKNGYATMSDNV
jgi:hypothetical protein